VPRIYRHEAKSVTLNLPLEREFRSDALTLIEEDHVTVPPGTTEPLGSAKDLPPAPPAIGLDSDAEPALPKMRAGAVWAMIILTFGTSMSMIVPMAYSLTVRLAQLAPGQEQLLGYIIGAGALANVLTMPVLGILSDRTRSRLGRRRPWAIGGAVVGLLGLAFMAVAPSVLLVGLGWAITLVAWQTAGNQVTYVQGDKLPEDQRGRVAALTGFANLGAPVIGIALVSGVSTDNLALFLLPGVVGVVGLVLFTVLVREDSRNLVTTAVSIGDVVSKYVFDPRQHRDYAWNWLGRFVLFFGLSFTTTYGTYFMASRLGLPVEQVAGVVAVAGLGGIAASALGAIGAGFLSDRLHRRKVFVLVAGIVALGAGVLSASSYSLTGILAGSILNMLAIGIFSTADQAIYLDTLPDRAESGRFIAIINLAQQIPTAIGPFVAPTVLAIGAVAGAPNYTLLFVASGVLFLAGALMIVLRVRGVR
jgi:MFS family permease